MKPFIYKRFGRWNLRTGDKVETVWSPEKELTLAYALKYFFRHSYRERYGINSQG